MRAFQGTATMLLELLTVLIVVGAVWLLVSTIRGRR
jgi:hypothetical protein